MRILIVISPLLFLFACQSTDNSKTNSSVEKNVIDTSMIIKKIGFADSIDRRDLIKTDTTSGMGILDTLLLEYDGVRFACKKWFDSKKLEQFLSHDNFDEDKNFPGFADTAGYIIEPASKDLLVKEEAVWSSNKFIFIGKKMKQKVFAEGCLDSTLINKVSVSVFRYYYYKIQRPYLISGTSRKSIDQHGDTSEIISSFKVK